MFRKSKIAVLVISFGLGLSAYAEPPKAYIDLEPGFFSGPVTIVVNGKKLKYGDDLKEKMKDNPIALQFVEKCQAYGTWSFIALWGSLGAGLTYFFVTPNEKVNGWIYWGILGTGWISSSILRRASAAYLYKAINAYNGVSPEKTSNLDFYLTPIASGAALGLKFNF